MVASARCLSLLLICSVVSTQTGCLTLSSFLGQKGSPKLDTGLLESQGYNIPPGGMPAPVSPEMLSGPRVVLEIRGEKRHLESIKLPMDRGVFIENVVQDAKLHEKFGDLNISIMRASGSGSPPIRLELSTNDQGRASDVGRNYGLLPGDHIIVIPDGRSGFQKYLDSQFRKKA